jgi:capsular exopolysaccharide synthesis family protein
LVTVQRGDTVSEAFQSLQPARAESARTEYDRLLALRLQEKALLTELGADHPQVQNIRKQIDEIDLFLKASTQALRPIAPPQALEPVALVRAYRRLLATDLTDLEGREQELENLFKTESDQAKDIVKYELEGETRHAELARKQQLFSAVVDRLREVNLIKEFGGYVTAVMSPVRPGEKVSPAPALTLAVALVVGLFFGSGMMVTAEALDRRFHGSDELRRALGVPVLAQIPGGARARKWSRKRGKGAAAGEPHAALVAHHAPLSADAEGYARLRTALVACGAVEERKILQVTGVDGGETAVLASNLAVALAQAGRSVLLVDANLRAPRIHDLFHWPPTPGVSDVLAGRSAPDDAVLKTSVANLSVLPGGAVAANSAELLAQPEFSRLLDQLREDFDLVLVDSPPLLEVSDAAEISLLSDGVLLSIASGSERKAAHEARDYMATLKAPVVGAVVEGELQSGIRNGR